MTQAKIDEPQTWPTKTVRLQPLAAIHFEEVLRINAQSFPAVGELSLTDLEQMAMVGGSHWVALRDGAVKGYMRTFSSDSAYEGDEFRYFQTNVQEPFLYVDQIAVSPDCLRSGIGRLFYQSVFQRAHVAKVTTVCCEVNLVPPNPQSMAFHHRLGFSPIGEGTVRFGWKVAFLKKVLV